MIAYVESFSERQGFRAFRGAACDTSDLVLIAQNSILSRDGGSLPHSQESLSRKGNQENKDRSEFMGVKSSLVAVVFAAAAFHTMPALAEGDAANGEKVFRKCKACHAVEEGKNKVGPSLYNIVDRAVGTVEGYKYSKAMIAYGEGGAVWDAETLGAYLEAPRKAVKGTKMAFAGLRKPEERADVIAYLLQFKPAE
ncbi:cytochrome c family protein [Pelagibius sp.]|uniref:c-type cytochrome n=1 Tax=Pelagibius sp. TaxID=1931238 RepID=UPI002AC3667E|nr:cytochrome c family protein [Pelagibius sp.]